MKIKSLIISIFYLVGIFGCKHPVINVSTNEFYHINADSTQDFIDLKLSDIADSFRLVRLETSEKAIISARDYYVSNKYIIAFSQDGYYKFLSNGKFLSKILSYGRGPDEISGIGYAHYYDEKNDLIYLEDSNLNQKLLVYDLNLEKFVAPIKKAIEGNWGSFAIFNDSLIIGKSPSYITNPYALFFQTFDGKFVSGIPNVKKRLLGANPEETCQPSYISIGRDGYRVSFELDDTLFTLKNNQLIPYISLEFKNPREKPPNAKVQKGDRQISFPKIEPSSFLIIGVTIIEEITWVTPTAGKSKDNRKYFFFNKATGKYSIIRTYEDDFSGVIQSPVDRINFPLFLKNGKIVVVYQPETIKKIAETRQINSILTPILKKEIVDINRTLQETDNPVLLIGRVKEKI
jgi:hypothetical protein